MTSRILLGAALVLATSTGAFAQSYTAPAGMPSAVAPGGLEGSSAQSAFDRGRAPVYYGSRDDGPATGSVVPARERILRQRNQ